MLEESQRNPEGETAGNSRWGVMDLTQWIMNIDDVELQDGLQSLELRTDGRERELMQRLMRRLNGEYTESDFVENTLYPDEGELQTHRENQRTAYMSRMGFVIETPDSSRVFHSSTVVDDTTLLETGGANCSSAPSTTTCT